MKTRLRIRFMTAGETGESYVEFELKMEMDAMPGNRHSGFKHPLFISLWVQ